MSDLKSRAKSRARIASSPACAPGKRTAASGDARGRSGVSSRPLRCAIYTRKSTEEGLDQDFNSLQAQREACQAYIASQRHEGWLPAPAAYDDGGYSGGSMDRPGLTRLLAEIRAGRIDVVVVYKVDRLTRSLADFAKIVEIFDAAGACFVSVTQSFNTTSSMGRLTLNVLLSFAQFEREVTAERIRDKIAAAKKKGLWMGGPVPFGYRAENRKLVIDESEAHTVRSIFELYLDKRSVPATACELKRRGIVTRVRTRRDGSSFGGIAFTQGPLLALLRNRVYVGELVHKGNHHPGAHAGIVAPAIFEAVQQTLTDQRVSAQRSGHRMASLLTGRIFDSAGNRMTPSHANKQGVRYRYYVSRALIEGEKERAGAPARISAPQIEQLVVATLRDRATVPSRSRQGESSEIALVERLLAHVQVFPDRITLSLTGPGQAERCDEASPDNSGDQAQGNEAQGKGEAFRTAPVTIDVACTLGTHPPQRSLIPGQAGEPNRRPRLHGLQTSNHLRLLQAILRAQHWLDDLLKNPAASIEAIARREGRSARNVRMFLNLAFLAPDLVEAAIDGNIPAALSPSKIAQSLPLDWSEQRRLILGSGAP